MTRSILGLALALAAVTSGPAHAVEKLKVGYLPVTGHAKLFVAKEEGIFAKEGLDVELVEFQNSADGITAVNAGKVDIGAFGTTAPLVHIAKGTDLRLIGGIMGEDAAIVTTRERATALKSVSDLKGRKVATVRLASGDAVLRGALHDAGLDWRKDVSIFELKNPPAVLEAVKSGQVDAGVIWGPHDVRAEDQGLQIVTRSRALQAGHPCCRLALRAERLQQQRTWVAFLRAILRAERFARDDHQKTIDDIIKYVKLDRAVVERAYYGGWLDQTSDPNLAGVRRFWKVMQESDFIESKEKIDGHVELSPYREALASLAKENPADPYWAELQRNFQERNR